MSDKTITAWTIAKGILLALLILAGMYVAFVLIVAYWATHW